MGNVLEEVTHYLRPYFLTILLLINYLFYSLSFIN